MYDPYTGGFVDHYGGYNPYEYQSFEETPPPPPDKNWVDVPKINKKYIKKIKQKVIKDDFKHLNEEQLYSIEVLLEYIELNRDSNDDKEQKDKKEGIAVKLRILHFPEREIPIGDKKTTTVISGLSKISSGERSAILGLLKYPPMEDLFQTMLSTVAGIVEKRGEGELELPEIEEESDKPDEEGDGEKEETAVEPITKPPVPEETKAKVEEESSKNGNRIELMKGKNVLLVTTGVNLIQNLLKEGLTITVENVEIIEAENEEDEESEIRTFVGSCTVSLPPQFPRAVLNSKAAEGQCKGELINGDMDPVGEVYLHVSLACLGLAVVTDMAEAIIPFYERSRMMADFSPDNLMDITEDQWDPIVHPRLAVTLLNMEPPMHLNRTGTEIFRDCFNRGLIPEGEEAMRLSTFLTRHCWWLDTAKNLEAKLSSKQSDISNRPETTQSTVCDNLDRMDSELYTSWRDHKIICRHFPKQKAEEEPNKLQSLYDELDELLKDKVKEPCETSETSSRSSRSSKRISDTGSAKRASETGSKRDGKNDIETGSKQ